MDPDIIHPVRRDFTAAEPRLDNRAPRDAGRAAWTTLAVLAGAAFALRTGDAIPGWIAGVPRGVSVCATMDEAEARSGLRLGKVRVAFAGYVFTAGGIRATARPIPAIAIAMQGGEGHHPLVLFQSRGGDIPATLRAPLPSFHEIAVPLLPGLSASLKAGRRTDGSVWQDLEWTDGTNRTALRYSGRTVELLRLARQLAEDAR